MQKRKENLSINAQIFTKNQLTYFVIFNLPFIYLFIIEIYIYIKKSTQFLYRHQEWCGLHFQKINVDCLYSYLIEY